MGGSRLWVGGGAVGRGNGRGKEALTGFCKNSMK